MQRPLDKVNDIIEKKNYKTNNVSQGAVTINYMYEQKK